MFSESFHYQGDDETLYLNRLKEMIEIERGQEKFVSRMLGLSVQNTQ